VLDLIFAVYIAILVNMDFIMLSILWWLACLSMRVDFINVHDDPDLVDFDSGSDEVWLACVYMNIHPRAILYAHTSAVSAFCLLGTG
jgi:hypothetical protein